jgi:O-antigen/teichoic acid export membrane protein
LDQATHKKQTVSGIKWNLLNQTITQGVTFVISLTLMRMLAPEQFGLIGMVTVFSGFLTVFRDFGLGNAIIQKKGINIKDKSTIFWVTLVVGFLLSILLLVLSPLLADFYNEPRVTAIASALSFLFFVQALGSTHNALLRKRLLYKKIFWVNTSAVIIGGTAALVAAYQDYGLWALVIQQVVTALLTTIALWLVFPFRPKFIFSLKRLKLHLKFGLPMVGTQSVNYWSRNADNLLIGRFLGADVLGIYSRAYSIMMLPLSRVSGVISSVMFPSLSIIQDDLARVKKIYLKMSRVIAFFTFPIVGMLIVVAEPFVKLVLGEQWIGMVPVLQILSIVGALQSVATLNGNIYMSQGKTALDFKVNIVSNFIIVLAFLIGVQYGIIEVAWAYLIAIFIIILPQWYIMGRLISCRLLEIIKNILPHTFIAVFLTIGSSFTLGLIADTTNLIKLIVGVVEFGIGWLLFMWIFSKNNFNEIRLIVDEALPNNKKLHLEKMKL